MTFEAFVGMFVLFFSVYLLGHWRGWSGRGRVEAEIQRKIELKCSKQIELAQMICDQRIAAIKKQHKDKPWDCE